MRTDGFLDARKTIIANKRSTQWKPILAQVREVLNRDWDPIGVYPSVHDEYDGYALRVVRLLFEGAEAATIAVFLATIERNQLGYEQATEERNLPIAQKLVQLWEQGQGLPDGREE